MIETKITSQSSQEAQEKFQQGESLFKQCKWDEAISAYRHAIKFNPDDSWYYIRLGATLGEQSKWDEAISAYRHGIDLNPKNSWYHVCLAKVLSKQKRWDEVVVAYRRAMELNPDKFWEYEDLGDALFEQKEWDEAAFAYRKAIKLKPDFLQPRDQLGKILLEQQKWQEATEVYQEAIKFKPNFSGYSNGLGKGLLQLKEWEEAANAFQQAIKLEPDCAWYHRNLGLALLGQGKYDRAIDCSKKAVELNSKSAELYFDLGQALRYDGQVQKAVDCYLKAVEFQPNYDRPYTALQYTKMEPTQLDKAIALYRSVLERKPNIVNALFNLGDALTKKGELDGAIRCYRTACYKKTIASNPKLAKLEWKLKKEYGPDYIIIGATKCGTSSLQAYLQAHPQIILPNKKELEFFNSNFDKGIDWYLSHFPSITDSSDFFTGEASPRYIMDPNVAQRIHKLFPKVKLIVLLRNPVERTVSSYYQIKKMGFDNSKTLTETVMEQIDQFKKQPQEKLIDKGNILLNSLYVYKLKPWMNFFAKEQFLILRSEEFFAKTGLVMNQVFGFLGLSYHKISQYKKVNAGSYPDINDELRSALSKFFKPYNQMLEECLEMKFYWD